MKGIKKTLMAGVLACSAFHIHDAKAEEMDKLRYGLNIGASFSAFTGYDDEVKLEGKKAENQYFDCIWFAPELYVGYALSDYFGLQLHAGYMKQGGKLQGVKEENGADPNKSTSIAMYSHGIRTDLHLSFYPLGYDNQGEDGMLRLSVGPTFYIPLSTTFEQNGTEITNPTEAQKKQVSGFDLGVLAMVEYGFDFGMSIVGQYGYYFMNRLNLEKDKPQDIFPHAEGLKTLHNHTATVGVGYNFASLFAE